MVRERSPSRTSSGQYLSPEKQQKPERTPLANISAKMQSPSSKPPKSDGGDKQASATSRPEFGKASPLRNPLNKAPPAKRPEPNIFIPKPRPAPKYSPQNPIYAAPGPAQSQSRAAPLPPVDQRSFYLPGQRPTSQAPAPTYSSAREAAEAFASQMFKRSFDPDFYEIPRPSNAPLPAVQPRPQPTFSSIGPKTIYQPFVPQKPTVDLTKGSDNEDEFDPDAEIRAERRQFGEPDPYMYVDSSKASENIKNLLEGAFDDEDDKSKTRLRKRAKKALKDGDHQGAKSLAGKLEALNIEEAEKKKAAEAEAQEDEEEEEEDGTVEGLNVKLLPHQVEGVAWMIDKEIGIRKKKGALPFGGILADDMGLGKTVQSISLILTNQRPGPDARPEHKNQQLPGKDVSKCTLVVAPLALIKQWEDEIKTKVSKSHALRVLVHHGSSRTKSSAELKKYDVVITTYQTLTSEHAGSNMTVANGSRIGVFGVHWYRIILDEAHSIKNRNAKATLASCAINAWYRWCLTGTPMQNNLDELQSLIKFLRIQPYCSLPSWKDAITTPIKRGNGGLAMKRLQFFLKAFMKRRTKDILKKEGALNFGGKIAKEGDEDATDATEGAKNQQGMKIVKREVVTVECDFDQEELDFYNRLSDRADQRLKEMTAPGKKNDYIGALVLLLRLRQACNHPTLIEKAMNKDKDAMTTGTGSNGASGAQTPRKQNKVDDGEMDDLTALMGGVSVETKQCDVCQFKLSPAEMRDGKVRCNECESDLAAFKSSGKGKNKTKVKKAKKAIVRPRNRRVVDDSDDEDVEDEGEWIADGPEQHIDLGKAGGSEDEDAEGGGETLGSIDSERSSDADSDEDDDSPPRAHRKRRAVKNEKVESDEEDTDEEEEDKDDGESDAPMSPIIAGLAPSGMGHGKPSTKIRYLLRILHAEMPKHKTIVFSQFTSMLDLIQPHLERSDLQYARYDGSMRPDEREASLHALRHDKKCRILLCSLKCGSLGLNLTAASRVVIVEPFWNPFVEEQAIDRVHRLNQTVDVKVYRLTVRNTVEAKILDLQERKRELAAAAIEGGKAIGKLSMQDILNLFQHDAEHNGHHEGDREMWNKFSQDHRLLDGPAAGFAQAAGFIESDRGAEKPGKKKLFKEHDIYGRRW